MKTEKFVKQRAREALKGNLVQLIAAMAMVFAAVMLTEIVQTILILLTQKVDMNTGEVISDENIIYYAIVAGSVAVLLFASPLLNGFFKAAANAVEYGDCEARDVFFYFRSAGLYFKTVAVDLLLYLMFAVITGVFNFSNYLSLLLPNGAGSAGEYALVVAVAVLTGVIYVLAYMFFVHYPLMIYALHSDISVSKCVFGSIGFSFKHFGKLFKLILSYFGWFALCFFVVPALYVIPYFYAGSLLSAKWLLELDRRGGAL